MKNKKGNNVHVMPNLGLKEKSGQCEKSNFSSIYLMFMFMFMFASADPAGS